MSEIELMMTKKDVAKIMRLSVNTLERHIRMGQFPRGFRLRNGHLRWNKSTVLEYLEQLQNEAQSA